MKNSIYAHRAKGVWAVVVLTVVLLGLGSVGFASEEHYKMLSMLEYSGAGQFSNQVEALFTVDRQLLPDNKVQYVLSTDDFVLAGV